MLSSIEKIQSIQNQFIRKDLPAFNTGDTIKMKLKVKEADKIRLHSFEGTVMRKTGGGLNASFTVRKVSFGEGVEKVFPLHSPVIDSLEVITRGDPGRAKLYYLRGRVGKGMKIKKAVEKAQAPVTA